ncbi:hypothetical protein IV57_GL000751 [Companilactobacillus kimchiensis]|uniref:MazG-like protein n=2 Tax=Companilactobacillus kimchiensis TaxID=993692 RepID=A0A0R2LIX8_9LACO|nr:hypothetical protein IV57_GL000751 [Companilactobacillus kimchiensis]
MFFYGGIIMDINELTDRSRKIREKYHRLELKQDGHAWTPEQDALAFLTDAGLVGRLIMAQEGSWPTDSNDPTLEYKIAESIWWLSSLADSQSIDLESAMDKFLKSREEHLDD